MFWGGECTSDVLLTPLTSRKNLNNRVANGALSRVIFDVRITSGMARCSRCGWALMCVQGSGPLKRKLRSQSLLKSFFETWESFYLSMDGQMLHFFVSKSSSSAFHTLPLRSLTRIHVELALDPSHARHPPPVDKTKLPAFEDCYLVILSTSSKDVIQLRCVRRDL